MSLPTVLGLLVSVTVCWAQMQCPSEQCNLNYRAQLEEVNQALRNAVDQVNRTLAEQKSLINQWKACGGNNNTQSGSTTVRPWTPQSTLPPGTSTYPPSSAPPPAQQYVAEKVASMEPCRPMVGPQSGIRSVTQLEGVIFVICDTDNEMRAYAANDFSVLPNTTLPTNGDSTKYISYIQANPIEKALYLGALSRDESFNYYNGYDVWRMDMSFNWVKMSSAQKDPTFNIGRLRVSRNGQMMYANTTHILFPQGPTVYSRAIQFAKPPLGAIDYVRGLFESTDGSFVMFADTLDYKYLLRVKANGDFVGNLSNGPVTGSSTPFYRINDMEKGPNEQLLLSEAYNDRVLILDPATNRLSELIPQVLNGNQTMNLWAPYFLSYDAQSQLLVVGEFQGYSKSKAAADENSLKVFRIKPKA